MKQQVVYLSSGDGMDGAIAKGLHEAGFEMYHTHSISETLYAFGNGHRHAQILVAEVQAGALPLLTLMKEQGKPTPTVLLFDRDGRDIHAPIQALQMGVREYLLASDSQIQRELRTRVLAETATQKISNLKVETAAPAPAPVEVIDPPEIANEIVDNNEPLNFVWDAVAHIIHVGNEFVRLSPIEGRMFNLLVTNRRIAVSMKELIAKALLKPNMATDEGIKLLRPHLVRLRNKLDSYPALAHRIVNMRGTGYMFV
ncbi:MAG: winged helix-turn-helix domain-containing protein [Anaerolineae bacterium]|nr:winged helix-turn-helix domain-containing protein [Anaerolineae bacterium]